MDIKKIALDALDEYESQESVVEQKDNGDGSVEVSISFSLDPKVVAQKAKAMAKGVKRDDLSDDLGDEDDAEKAEAVFADDVTDDFREDEGEGFASDDEDDDEDPYNGVSTEDSANDTVFMDALDEVVGVESATAEDARQNSRHSQTPLENCRAKDPRFCPYHGDKAWTSYLEDELKKAGISGGTAKVSVDNGRFEASVTVPTGMSAEATKIMDGLLATKGVVHNPTGYKEDMTSSSGYTEKGKFRHDFGMMDRTGRLNEWVDDYMSDVANDPNAEIDMDDFNSLLEEQEDIDAFEAKMDRNDPNDVKTYNGMVDAAEKTYHVLMAQQYMKDVTDDKKAVDKGDEIDKQYQDSYDVAHKDKDEVDAAKVALFGGKGNFPAGFAKANPWADSYNKASQKLFYWGDKDFQAAGLNLAQAKDLKAKRTALAEMDYKKDNFVNGVPAYAEAKKQFMKDLYDWASKDAKYSGKVAAAFPNGRPQ